MARPLSVSMLTQRQIRSFVDVSRLLDTAVDCLRFVTEFFNVIRQSGPHLYHSALLLAPRSSVVRNLYSQQIRSPVSQVVNVPTWDSCTASAETGYEIENAVWSPCGRFIATTSGSSVQVLDSSTLEALSAFRSRWKKSDHALATFHPMGAC